jgi:hypothetical protein
MDETSLAYVYGGQKGNIKITKRMGRFRQQFVERLTASERRQCVTLLVCLASTPEVHAELPQIFLGSSRHFSARYLAEHRPRMPDGMYLWANERGWMTQEVCAVLITAIKESLGALLERYHVVLLMDAHRAHISETICRRARTSGMTLVYVPAKLTWLLQPADTHLFAQFKCRMRRTYTQTRLDNPDGRLQPDQWLDIVCHCLSHVVMGRSWGHSFRKNGISDQQCHTSMYVRSMVGLTREEYPTMKPSVDEIRFLFGMRNIPYDLLMPSPAPLARAEFLAAHAGVPRARRLPALSVSPTPAATAPISGHDEPDAPAGEGADSSRSHGGRGGRGRGGDGDAGIRGSGGARSSGGGGRPRGTRGGAPAATQ